MSYLDLQTNYDFAYSSLDNGGLVANILLEKTNKFSSNPKIDDITTKKTCDNLTSKVKESFISLAEKSTTS